METSLTNKGYVLKKNDLDPKQISLIKKELTPKPKETPYTCVWVDYSFPVYTETKDHIYVPRFWGTDKFGEPKENKLGQEAKLLNKKKLKLTFKPRDYQVDPLKETLMNLKKTGGSTLQVECGWGKSFSGVCLAYALGLKTIIIAPRVKIVTQWVSEIKRFIPEARVGLIQGETREIDNVDFCVATLQTIGLKNFTDDDFKSFGFSIFDELPFFAANKMSTVLWKVYSKYNLGLSADPERADGLDKIFRWYLGPSVVKSSKPITRTHNTVVRIVYPPEKFYDKRITSTGNINLAGMINDLTESNDRFKVIMDQIESAIEDPKRKILVMADRRGYLEKLCMETKKKYPDKECLLFLGGLTKKKLAQIDADLIEEKYDIIFATYALIGVGVSIDYLNTAVFATPKKDKMTEQASGRIMRKDHEIEPLIIDIVDDNGIFRNQARTRRKLYNNKKWIQQSLSLDSNLKGSSQTTTINTNITIIGKNREKKDQEELEALADLL